jgi:hypothetical protein
MRCALPFPQSRRTAAAIAQNRLVKLVARPPRDDAIEINAAISGEVFDQDQSALPAEALLCGGKIGEAPQ